MYQRSAFYRILFCLVLWLFVSAAGGCISKPEEVEVGVPTSGLTPIVEVSQTVVPVESTQPPPATLATSRVAPRIPVVVFSAGSLIKPFSDLEDPFEAANPDLDLQNEFHGSIQVMRHVSELHEPIDVVATADQSLIPMMMYAVNDPDTGKPYAAWYLRFATNRLALAFQPGSKFSAEINDQNWYEVISRPGVRLGIADPRFDASGYRALMALRLAENFYQKHGIFNQVIKGQFRYPVTLFEEDEYSEITVPEIVEPVSGSGVIIRGASVELIALLESGDLDYAFEYESVIRQHGLAWIDLPDAINLGSGDLAEEYARVQVELDFQRFASLKPLFRGEQIGYGITIPESAPHPEAAIRFIQFLFSEKGQAVLLANYQPLVIPLVCDGEINIPAALRGACTVSSVP